MEIVIFERPRNAGIVADRRPTFVSGNNRRSNEESARMAGRVRTKTRIIATRLTSARVHVDSSGTRSHGTLYSNAACTSTLLAQSFDARSFASAIRKNVIIYYNIFFFLYIRVRYNWNVTCASLVVSVSVEVCKKKKKKYFTVTAGHECCPLFRNCASFFGLKKKPLRFT